MVHFEEHFWGDKYNGFDVLQQNFKLGINASKEFAEFLKERSSIEETYSKSLLKLAHKCSTANSHVGCFEPCWKFLQSSTEKLANVHNQVIQNLNEVSKAVRDYGEEQREKQKQLKNDFTVTVEAVLCLQNLSAALVKAKESYQQRSLEVEKCRKDFTNLKDIKLAEAKFKKSSEDYKQLIDKRETARKEFHEKMSEISQKLQTVEEQHLTQMLVLLTNYGESIKVERFLLDQIIDEFVRNMLALTVENLLQQFINLKQTGKDIPEPVEFEEIEMKSKPVDIDAISQALKEEKKRRKTEKREKKAVRKRKKEKIAANGTVSEATTKNTSTENETDLQLDAEGYVIRPVDTDSVGKISKDSSSDSDSDSDDERQKIQVRIKPVGETKGSNSDLNEEQLKKLSATITLMSPATIQQRMGQQQDEKKFVAAWGSHSSLNKLSAKSRSNNDLLNLDKNADTASLHSLPMNSSFPGLDSSSSTNNLKNTDCSTSPVASPNNGSNPGSIRFSPSESFDQSSEIIFEKPAISVDDAPPPLPDKSRTQSLLTSLSNSSDSIDTNKNIGKSKSTGALGGLVDKDNLSGIPMFSNNLFVEDPVDNKTTTVVAKSFTNIEVLKPPPEKRSSPTLPPPILASRNLPTSAASLPRPKSGQLVAPPSSSRRTLNQSASGSSVSPNQSSMLPPTSGTNPSSLTDLLDINFSSTAPTLSPENATSEKESTTSQWVNLETNLETSSATPSSSTPNNQDSSEQDNFPPAIPRRGAFPAQPAATTQSAASIVNLVSTDRAIPIAVAFIETVNGVFKGSDDKSCIIRVTGDMTISFPANIISMLSNNPSPPVLSFLVTGTSSLEQIFPNKALVERGGQLAGGEGMTFKFNMVALAAYLKKQSEQGTKASYYNIDILKYQVRCNGITSAPLQLSAYWRCDAEQTDLKIDYKYNVSCMSSPVSLNNVSLVVPVDGGVAIMQSRPTAIWSSEHQRCMWKLPAVSSTVDNTGSNALRARFDITQGPTNPVPIAVQFAGEGSTISLLNFDLTSPAYKLSLVKKRFASGKYVVE